MLNSDKKNLDNGTETPMIMVEGPSRENLRDIPYADGEREFEEGGETSRRGSLAVSHRRNSVSLPNLEDLKVFTQLHQEVTVLNSQSDLDTDDEYGGAGRGPSRNVRRKSVLSPKMLTPPDPSDFVGVNSSGNSITSVNSLASLLKEKIQNLPQTIRKKKSNDYKIKVFVMFLFITIVVLICCAYFLYNQKVLAKAYFERIKFNKNKRLMKIYNKDGTELFNARLGTTINYDKVLPCLPQDERHDGSICLEWMDRARLYLGYYALRDNVKCYNLNWISLNEDLAPTDCIEMTPGVHWYGGGQTRESAWPLEKANHDFYPFVTGDEERNEWGNILKRYFINSKGAAIIVDERTPLYVSVKNSTKKELCLSARYDDFAFVNKFTLTPELNYSICTAGNITHLHSQLSKNTLWDGVKKEDFDVIEILLSEPVWEITTDEKETFTEEMVSNFTNGIIGLLDLQFKLGHVLLNSFWQNHAGDFEVDIDRFPSIEKIMKAVTRRGFRTAFTIQPFISTESINFAEAVERRLLVLERFSGRSVPALTSFKTTQSAGVLDITNNRTVPWLIDKLNSIINKYKITAFYLELGNAYDMPHYYQCEKPLANPDEYKTLFVNSIQNSVSLFGVSDAVELPRPPAFVSLPKVESSWDGLRRVVPTILAYGIIGYPFVMPGAVGGDYSSIESQLAQLNGTFTELEDPELYIRWMQLASFLPIVRFNRLPNSYGDKRVLDIVIALTFLRQKTVKPVLRKYARESLNLGLPIIRPLWMLDPDDPFCQTVVDQFSIGKDIIVAPILYPGVRVREVYLPAGVWKDGIRGSLRKGNSWQHDYKVEADQVAYFERMPDDTRF